MPVNMDPSKRRKSFSQPQQADSMSSDPQPDLSENFGEETEEDREKALADAESKNLWEATEVIDMDSILPGSGAEA